MYEAYSTKFTRALLQMKLCKAPKLIKHFIIVLLEKFAFSIYSYKYSGLPPQNAEDNQAVINVLEVYVLEYCIY